MRYQLYRYNQPNPNDYNFRAIEFLSDNDSNMWKRTSIAERINNYKFEPTSNWIKITFEPSVHKFSNWVKDLTKAEAFLELL